MRGYGGDEETVHRLLNPSIPVYVSPDRVKGTEGAKKAGADVAVLDDAFQHRALRADAYVVLIAAEEWVEQPRLLPRGPWREPLSALRRAQLLVITRKVASLAKSLRVSESLARQFPTIPLARAYIGVSKLARYEKGQLQVLPSAIGFRAAIAVAGVARADAVWEQLRNLGVSVERCSAFPDHHRFSASDIAAIREAAATGPLVATLKDAVKLRPLLPTDMAIYVPLQIVEWEAGSEAVEQLLAGVLKERPTRLEFSR
jgi:tetraacyldisaccharide 4'-kinase